MYLQIYKYLVNTLLERHTSRSVQEVHTLLWKKMMKLLLWMSWVGKERDVMNWNVSWNYQSCLSSLISWIQLVSHTRNSGQAGEQLRVLKYSNKNQSSRGTAMRSVPCHFWQSHHVTPQVYNWSSSILQLIRFLFFFALMPPSRNLFQIFPVIMSRSLLIISLSFFTARLY